MKPILRILQCSQEVNGGRERTFSVSAKVTGTAIRWYGQRRSNGVTPKLIFGRLRFWISFALRLGNKSGLAEKNRSITNCLYYFNREGIMDIILVKFWYYILDDRKIKSQVKLFYITHYISAYKPIIMFHKSNIITKMIVYEWIKVAGRFRSSPAWLHQVAISHFKVWFCITYHSII